MSYLFNHDGTLITEYMEATVADVAGAADLDSAALVHLVNINRIMRIENSFDTDVAIVLQKDGKEMDKVLFLELGAGREINVAEWNYPIVLRAKDKIYLYCTTTPTEGKLRILFKE